jgi:hypothetical protein
LRASCAATRGADDFALRWGLADDFVLALMILFAGLVILIPPMRRAAAEPGAWPGGVLSSVSYPL